MGVNDTDEQLSIRASRHLKRDAASKGGKLEVQEVNLVNSVQATVV